MKTKDKKIFTSLVKKAGSYKPKTAPTKPKTTPTKEQMKKVYILDKKNFTINEK